MNSKQTASLIPSLIRVAAVPIALYFLLIIFVIVVNFISEVVSSPLQDLMFFVFYPAYFILPFVISGFAFWLNLKYTRKNKVNPLVQISGFLLPPALIIGYFVFTITFFVVTS